MASTGDGHNPTSRTRSSVNQRAHHNLPVQWILHPLPTLVSYESAFKCAPYFVILLNLQIVAFPYTTLFSLCLCFLSSNYNPFYTQFSVLPLPLLNPIQSLLSHPCVGHNIRQTQVDFPHYLPSLILLRGSKSERGQVTWLMIRPLGYDGSNTLDSKASKLKLN